MYCFLNPIHPPHQTTSGRRSKNGRRRQKGEGASGESRRRKGRKRSRFQWAEKGFTPCSRECGGGERSLGVDAPSVHLSDCSFVRLFQVIAAFFILFQIFMCIPFELLFLLSIILTLHDRDRFKIVLLDIIIIIFYTFRNVINFSAKQSCHLDY